MFVGPGASLYSGRVNEDWAWYCEEIVNAAEKYHLPDLMAFCDKKLHVCCNPENAMELLKVAKHSTNLPTP